MDQDDTMSIASSRSSGSRRRRRTRLEKSDDDDDDEDDDNASRATSQSWSQRTDLSALLMDETSRMSTTSSHNSQREQEEDDGSGAFPPLSFQRVQSQKLPNGAFMRYVIERDPEQEAADAAQSLAALQQNMSIGEVREAYKAQTLFIHNQMQQAMHTQRAKRPETEGSVAHYCRTLSSRSSNSLWIPLGRSCLFPVVRASNTDFWHTDVLPSLAKDIDEGVLSTLVERPCVARHGVRLCARLRYSTFVQLNTDAHALHFRLIGTLAKECFPGQSARCYTMYVAASTPGKITLHKHKARTSLHMCSCSYQIVWPFMPVLQDARFLRLFWMAIDIRIRKQDAFYANVVDHNAYHERDDTVRLQVLRAHKCTPCLSCRDEQERFGCNTKPRQQMLEVGDYDSSLDDESDSEKRSSGNRVCDCIQGKKIGLVTYDLVYVLRLVEEEEGENADEWHVSEISNSSCGMKQEEEDREQEHPDTLTRLTCMSIVPCRSNWSEARIQFQVPSDAPDLRDTSIAVRSHREYGDQKQLTKQRTSEVVDRQLHPEVYALCDNIIRFVSPPTYNHLVSSRITLQHKSKMIFVDVQGNNRKWCFLHGGHHEKGIYFIIQPLTFRVSAYCYDPTCKKIIKLRSDIRRAERQLEKQQGKKKKKNVPQQELSSLVVDEMSNRCLTISQQEAFQKMEAYIAYDTNYREPLFDLLGLEYRGKVRSKAKLVQDADLATTLEDTTEYFDETLGFLVPRSLANQSLAVKKKYLESQPSLPMTRIVAREEVVPFVVPVATKHLDSYLSIQSHSLRDREALHKQNLANKDVLL